MLYVPACMHTCIPTYQATQYIHTCMHTCIYIYFIQKCIHFHLGMSVHTFTENWDAMTSSRTGTRDANLPCNCGNLGLSPLSLFGVSVLAPMFACSSFLMFHLGIPAKQTALNFKHQIKTSKLECVSHQRHS